MMGRAALAGGLCATEEARSMAIKRMNHAVLYVRSVDRTFAFYRDVLGFRVVNEMPGAKFLQAPDSTNDHDLGIFEIGVAAGDSTAGRATVGLYHIAWEVQTLADLRYIAKKLADAGALVGATDHSTTKALYGKDPDGLEFEVCWLVPQRLLTDDAVEAKTRMRTLDIEADIERYGLETVGGI
jgi:catechol-2,3-dioxygenase